ncbi:MAG: DUF445 family protein, partial [Sedimentibacter sp.]
MNDILLNYITQAILGGASGYITNDYAINMLFKEYTPLKIGGVIKKTRSEFIDNLSTMVENDIINKEKLHEILNDSSFKAKFQCLTADFFQEGLYEIVGINTFSDISGFDSSVNSTDKFVVGIINEHMSEITNLIIDNLKIDDIFNRTQSEKICDSIYITLQNALKDTPISEAVLMSIYNENKDFKIKNLFKGTESTVDILCQNITNALAGTIKTSDFSPYINDIVNAANLSNTLSSGKTVFYNRKLKDLFNISSELKANLSVDFIKFINSEKGQQNIFNLFDSLFTYGKSCDKSIFQLLDSSFEEGLKNYISENLPHLTKKIVKWINDNSSIIDNIIEDAIDEVIIESDGMKGRLLSKIKNTYFNNLSKKYSIVEKIISYVEKVTEPEKLSGSISSKIIELLNNLSVREIIIEAETNNFTSLKAAKLFSDYINTNFEGFFNEALNNISNISLKDIMPDYSLDSINYKAVLTSKIAMEMFNKKINRKFKSMMDVNLESLINQTKAKEIAKDANNFIAKVADSNSSTIKKWFVSILPTAFEEKNSLKSIAVYDKLSEEIHKQFELSATKFKTIKLSQALDKLNQIDNLPNNSSEALRSYVIDNIDSILKGSIKGITSSNLNKLSDDDLVAFANEFIGKELKPIMFFGGVLGIAAGIILATFQNAPASLGQLNVSSMITYAFVGFLTNVVAINMLFKPYREIKILRKIPLLRHFSLGFIVKNQKSFAKSTSQFIDSNLLSKKSINELFTTYEENIKESFIGSVANNNYETLNNILINNKTNIVKSLFYYGKNKISANINEIGNFAYKTVKGIKLSAFLTDKVIKKLSKQGAVKLSETNVLSHSLYLSINSNYSLKSKFSNTYIKESFEHLTVKYYGQLKEFILDKESIKNYILAFQNKYSDFTNKTIDDLFDDEKKQEFSIFISSKIKSIILSKSSRDKASQSAVNLFNRYFHEDKHFEDLFNGKLKEYLDKKTPVLLQNISTMIKNNVKESKPRIALMVQSEIKSNLGFLERGMYSIVDGDDIVDELLKKIIQVKIPQFIDDKEEELSEIANNILDEKFYKAKVQVLHKGLDKIQINELIDKFVVSENFTEISGKIQPMVQGIFKRSGSKKISELLNVIYFKDIKSILNAYDGELSAMHSQLCSTIDINEDEIISKLTALINYASDEFMKTSFKEIFSGVSQEELKVLLDNGVGALNKDGEIEKLISLSLNEYKNYTSAANICDIVDKEEFINSTVNYVKKLINNSETEIAAKAILTSIVEKSINENFTFIDKTSKDYILNSFVDSCILSLRRNLDEILKAVEFDKIAKEEIEKMEPEKIHEMFNSFGEKYFRSLMLYGFGGFVFGINMYVGFALTSVKLVSELFNKKKDN